MHIGSQRRHVPTPRWSSCRLPHSARRLFAVPLTGSRSHPSPTWLTPSTLILVHAPPERRDHHGAALEESSIALAEGVRLLALDIDQADDLAVAEDRHDDL